MAVRVCLAGSVCGSRIGWIEVEASIKDSGRLARS